MTLLAPTLSNCKGGKSTLRLLEREINSREQESMFWLKLSKLYLTRTCRYGEQSRWAWRGRAALTMIGLVGIYCFSAPCLLQPDYAMSRVTTYPTRDIPIWGYPDLASDSE